MIKNNENNLPSPPLLCWDIFLDSYHRKLALAEDFNQLNKLSASKNWINDWDIETKLFRQGKIIIVTDTSLRMVYASSNVYEMNGYDPAELHGKNPKMFQGPETSPETRMQIRQAISNRQPIEITILNYKKNGQIYQCHVEEYPVFNKNRELSHFIAFENVVTAAAI